jgi:uncharacterized ferritin-like protein (DUF455 family)
MNVNEFAEKILFGSTLEEKLFKIKPSELDYSNKHSSKISIKTLENLKFPSRPKELKNIGHSEFPNSQKLDDEKNRCIMLHFFANHELLAMELMAYSLLKFQDTPVALKKGLIQIILEEQDHFKLYVNRMNELKFKLGEIPVNTFFWDSTKNATSMLQFLAQISLTFEQANLDFSLYYLNLMKKIGDETTADILNKVYEDEIGHVKHGWVWFNKLRPNAETTSAWNAYKDILPYPMNPERAKGKIFDLKGRLRAGISDEFIKELKAYSGSKGRPPQIYFYNPLVELEQLEIKKNSFCPPKNLEKLAQDLELIYSLCAHSSDIFICRKKPSSTFILKLKELGFDTPSYLTIEEFKKIRHLIKPSGFCPWGISPKTYELFYPMLNNMVSAPGALTIESKKQIENYKEKNLYKIFSKIFSLQEDERKIFYTINELQNFVLKSLEQKSQILLKAPFGSSGQNTKKILSLNDFNSSTLNWAQKIIKKHSAIIADKYLNRIFDFSTQALIKHTGEVEIFPSREFFVTKNFSYLGTLCAHKFPFNKPEIAKFLYQKQTQSQTSLYDELMNKIREIGNKLFHYGYTGFYGVDSFIYKDHNNNLALRMISEVNPRFTMGLIALKLETKLLEILKKQNPKIQAGVLCVLNIKKINPNKFQKPYLILTPIEENTEHAVFFIDHEDFYCIDTIK